MKPKSNYQVMYARKNIHLLSKVKPVLLHVKALLSLSEWNANVNSLFTVHKPAKRNLRDVWLLGIINTGTMTTDKRASQSLPMESNPFPNVIRRFNSV